MANLADLKLRRRLWERDNGICGICGQAVDLEKSELDHVLPRIEGGPDDESNLRIVHMRCNRRRGQNLGWEREWRRREQLSDSDLLDVNTLSIRLKVPVPVLRRLARLGEIPATDIAPFWRKYPCIRFRLSEVEAALRKRRA